MVGTFISQKQIFLTQAAPTVRMMAEEEIKVRGLNKRPQNKEFTEHTGYAEVYTQYIPLETKRSYLFSLAIHHQNALIKIL